MSPSPGHSSRPAGPWTALGVIRRAERLQPLPPPCPAQPARRALRLAGLPGTPATSGNCPPAARGPWLPDSNHRLRCAHNRGRGCRGRESHPARTARAPQKQRPRARAQRRTHPLASGFTSTRAQTTEGCGPHPTTSRAHSSPWKETSCPLALTPRVPPPHPSPRQLLIYFLSFWIFAYSGHFL